MVAAKAMLDAALELVDVAAAIGTALHAEAVALAVAPLPGVGVAREEPVDAKSVAVVAAVDPVPLVDPTTVASPLVDLALVDEPLDLAAGAPAVGDQRLPNGGEAVVRTPAGLRGGRGG